MKKIETKLVKKIIYQESDRMFEYKIANLLSMFADLATINAIQIGMWKDELKGKYGWMLSRQTLKLKRPISLEEEVNVITRVQGGSRVQFGRSYDIESEGEIIGGAYSIWTLIDLKNRRIVKPQQVGLNILEIEKTHSFVENYEPVLKNIKTQQVSERQVLYNDVDVNQHMNNAKYIEWALDLISYQQHQEYYIEQLSMHYKKEIAPLTMVQLFYGEENNDFKVEFKVDDVVCFALSGKLKRRKC